MKTLYLLGGPMGVGKTTVGKILSHELLDCSVFLDGDWCWDAHPFVVTEESKAMVLDNICHLLNSFIHCSAYDHIVFCWVMHEQSIIDDILARLDLDDCRVVPVSLVCTPDALRTRLQGDVNAGIRQPDVIERGIQRLPLYSRLDTRLVDTTNDDARQVAHRILRLTDMI